MSRSRDANAEPMSPRTAVVVVASTRAAAGAYPDRTGPLLVDWLRGKGFQVSDPVVVPDGPAVGAALRAALGVDLLITTGGTGLTPTDGTPEATAPLLDRVMPGLAEAIRRAGGDAIPTAALSRGLAGVAGRTLVVNLPGSSGGVRDGIAVLDRVLDHALDQLAGGDHPPDASPAAPAVPPVAAPSSGQVVLAVVTEQILDPAVYLAAATDPAVGGVASFAGIVRDHDGGRPVESLEYQAHPDAAAVVATIAAEIAARSGIVAVAVGHRYGTLRVGDVAMVCAVGSAHRREALSACADLVEEVKRRIPVWKRQVFADGSSEWVGSA